MNTTFATFNDAVLSASTTALHNYVLPAISSWLLTNKGVTVSATELATVLQLQAPQRNIVVGTATPTNVAVPATGRKKANTGATEVAPPGQGCIRVPKTGAPDKKGIPCGKARMDGKMYCKVCNYLKSGGNETKTAGTVTKPTGLTAPTTDVAPQAEPEELEISATQPAKFPDYYLETTCKLLFKEIGGNYVFYAKLADDESKVLRLSETDRIYGKAKRMFEASKEDEEREFATLSAMLKPLTNGITPIQVPLQVATISPQPQMSIQPQIPTTFQATPNLGTYNPQLAQQQIPTNFGVPQTQFVPNGGIMYGQQTFNPIPAIAPISF